MDTLLKCLLIRGHSFEPGWYGLYAVVLGERFSLKFHERMKTVKSEDGFINAGKDKKYKPTELFQFVTDEKSWKLSNILMHEKGNISAIIAHIELTATSKAEWKQQEKFRLDAIAEEKRQIEELKKRKEQDLANFKDLFKIAARWRAAMDLQGYIDAVEQKVLTEHDSIPKQTREWISWARKKADWYDPIIESVDEWFKDVDRETLSRPGERQ